MFDVKKDLGIIWDADHLVALRKALKLNQKVMSQRLGRGESQYRKYEKGLVALPEDIKGLLDAMQEELFVDEIRKVTLKDKDGQFHEVVNSVRVEVDDLTGDYKEYEQIKTKTISAEEKATGFHMQMVDLKRKGQSFNRCSVPSLDKITLQKNLNSNEQRMLGDMFSVWGIFAGDDTYVEDFSVVGNMHKLKSGSYVYMYTLANTDCKISVKYGLISNNIDPKLGYEPKLTVEFNPNKLRDDNPYFIQLMKVLRLDCLAKSWDIAKDFELAWGKHFATDNIGSLGQWEIGTIDKGLTKYFCKCDRSGAPKTKEQVVKVYDKTKELLAQDGKKIDEQLLRYEYRHKEHSAIPLVAINEGNFREILPMLNFFDCDIKCDSDGRATSITELAMVNLLLGAVTGTSNVNLSIQSNDVAGAISEGLKKFKTELMTISYSECQAASSAFLHRYIKLFTDRYELDDLELERVYELRDSYKKDKGIDTRFREVLFDANVKHIF